MSDPTSNSPGGTTPAAGGSGEGDGTPQHVSFETYKRSVDAEKNAKRLLQETQEKLLVFENTQREIEQKKLLEEKRFTEVIDTLTKEKQQLLDQKTQLEQDRIDSRKLNAALGLMQEKGIVLDSKYLGLIPLESIRINQDGTLDHTSVASTVQTFQKEHPRLTISGKSFLPSDKPGQIPGKISVDEWKKLGVGEKHKALKEGRVNTNLKA